MIALGLLGIAATIVKYRLDNKEEIQKKKVNKEKENKFIRDWNITMKYNGIKNKNEQTFEVLKYVPREKYGCDAIISIPKGLSYDDLIKRKNVIESSLGGIVDMEWKQFNNCIYLKYAEKQIDDKYKYTPVKLKPHQLLLGITPFYEYVYSDMSINPHVLFSGSNNSGKTYCLLTALTNLVCTHSQYQVELYLTQISSKKDLRKFANVKHTKYYADTPIKALLMYKHLLNIMDRRNDIFHNVKDGYVDTIYEFNKRLPKRKLSYIYVVADEFSFYMPNSTDSEEVKEWKLLCLDMIFQLIKEGRNCGIYLALSLQRPDRENCPASLKSQCNTKVVLKQNNIASSLVTVDSEEAIHLKQREAIVLTEEKKYMKTMYLDNNMIEEFIKQYIDENHKYLNLEGYNKISFNNQNEVVDKPNTPPIENKGSNKAKSKIKTGGKKGDNTKG